MSTIRSSVYIDSCKIITLCDLFDDQQNINTLFENTDKNAPPWAQCHNLVAKVLASRSWDPAWLPFIIPVTLLPI